MTRITKAELLAKIDTIEQQFAAEIRAHEETKRQLVEARAELAGLYVEQRPSRREPLAPVVTETIVRMAGVQYRKVRAWEHGRLVTTYKPVAVQ